MKLSKTIIIAIILPYTLTSQDNTFTGTTDSDWDVATNWSTGKVPPSDVVQKITIAANCEVPNTNSTDYTLAEGSIFRINSGVTFTNNGIGNWTFNGTFDIEGTYIADLTINGIIAPGDNISTWTCGNPIVYGGQSYNTIQLGTQCWIAENLNIGTKINSYNGSDNQTDNSIIEKYCYDNDESNCDTYGGLYQWNEMMQYATTESTQGVCPTGWHIPSDTEWKTLEMQLGMSQPDADNTGWRGTNEGSKMSGNEPLWTNGVLDGNGAGTPPFGTSGFEGLSAGYRNHFFGSFANLAYEALLWSSTENVSNAWTRFLYYDNTDVRRNNSFSKSHGVSIRCVRD